MALLSAVAVGASADDSRITVHRVTVPAAHFIANTDDIDYTNGGSALRVDSGGIAAFTAPIPDSYDGTDHIFITRVEVIAHDDGAGAACLAVWRAEPGDGGETAMADVGCTVDSGVPVQSIAAAPTTRRVNAGQRAYLWLVLDPGPDVFGARVTYATNP